MLVALHSNPMQTSHNPYPAYTSHRKPPRTHCSKRRGRAAEAPSPRCVTQRATHPEPWKDPKNGSTLGLYNLHHRSITVQNWGFHFLDPSTALGKEHGRGTSTAPGRPTVQQSALDRPQVPISLAQGTTCLYLAETRCIYMYIHAAKQMCVYIYIEMYIHI